MDIQSTLTNPDFKSGDIVQARDSFPTNFRLGVFHYWYTNGEPNYKELYALLDDEGLLYDPESGFSVSKGTLKYWVNEIFKTVGALYDEDFMEQYKEKLITDRMIMWKRHEERLLKIQELSFEFIETHGLENSRNALSAFFDSVKLEREMRGIPIKEFESISKKSNDELIEDFKELVNQISRDADTEAELRKKKVT